MRDLKVRSGLFLVVFVTLLSVLIASMRFETDELALGLFVFSLLGGLFVLHRINVQRAETRARERIEANLRERDEQHRAVTHGTRDVIFQTDGSGAITFLNPAWEALTGQQLEEGLRQHFLDFVDRDDREQLAREFLTPLLSGEADSARAEFRYRSDQDEMRWVEVYAGRVSPAGEGTAGAAGTIRDISDRKRAEMRLAESEERFRCLFDQNPDAVYSLDRAGRFRSANDACTRITGYTNAEILQMTFLDLLVSDRRRQVIRAFVRARSGEAVRLAITIRHKSGKAVHLHAAKLPILVDGTVVGVFGIATDVTERVGAEGAVRESEERFRQLAATSPFPIVSVDERSEILFVNQALEQLFGYTAGEINGQSLTQLMPERFREAHLQGMGRYVRTGERRVPHTALELVGLTKAGREVPLEISFGEFRDADRRLFTGFMRDLSEREEREQELRASEERFRQIAENINEVFWLADPEKQTLLYVSPAYEKIWGRSIESLYASGSSWLEAIHPEDRARVAEALPRQVLGTYDVQYRIVRPDGAIRWIRAQAYPVRDSDGLLVRVAGVAGDVTAIYEAEQALVRSEELFRTITERASDIISIFDTRGRAKYHSPAFERLLGRSAIERLGEPAFDRVHPEDHAAVGQALKQVMERPRASAFLRMRLQHADGSWRVFETRLQNLTDDPAVQGILSIAREVTERVHAEEEIRRREEHLRALIEHSAEIITILDSNGTITYESPAIERVLGYAPDELVGRNAFTFVHPEDVDVVLSLFSRVVAEEGYNTTAEYRFRHKDESWRTLVSVGTNALENQAVGGIVVNSRDVTEERAREEHLRRAERLASVGTLVGGVAHELNNPLHAIVGFADLMLAEDRESDKRETLEMMGREARRAARIVSNLRLLARQTQEAQPKLERVDLNEVVRHVLRTRDYHLRTSDIEVQQDLARSLPDTVGDPAQLEQVLLNLIVNAEQALRTVERTRRLIIRTRPSRGGVALSVHDNGPGVASEHIDRLFDPFWTTKPPGEGTGLGLSLVHNIITEHGGEIQVESEPGEGAAFNVQLPGAPERDASVLDPSNYAAAANVQALEILVVEDEEPVRQLLERVLVRWGHRVDTTANGREALQRIAAMEEAGQTYDVIFSDLRMPGMSGDKFLRRLKELGTGHDRRLVFLTGDVSSPDIVRIMEEEGLPVLEKPYDQEMLAEVLERFRK